MAYRQHGNVFGDAMELLIENGFDGAAENMGLIDSNGPAMEKATFAAGCFWGVEAAFRQKHPKLLPEFSTTEY